MTQTLENKKILLAVTGGIAAYKAAELVRLYVKAGASVKVVMTKAAESFIPAKTLAVLSTQDVLRDGDENDASPEVAHVTWARWADAVVLAPTTANSLAKIANGLADNRLTEVLLAANPAVKIMAPAMNDQMLANPATQRNLALLKQDGWRLIEPAVGFLAEGYEAKGRLADLQEIVQETTAAFYSSKTAPVSEKTAMAANDKPLFGRHLVITAGGTKEPIDPVRYLTNRSSGKMGYALAEAALAAGAKVTLVAAAKRDCSTAINLVIAPSAKEMLFAVEEAMKKADGFIGAAAVSDFALAAPFDQKVKKQGDGHLTLDLVQNPDILKTVGQNKKPGQAVIGFAAETQDLLANAQKKLAAKQADMIVANDVTAPQAGFDKDSNQVTLIQENQAPITIGPKAKSAIAKDVIEQVVTILDHQ
ncbi:bifunctional phosphopantothenoylcysteine decarboxylase/phosphopantothenate--cysteine ligase CoaBC [Fructobacillus sp. M1-13]|uniref:Coenzyme A biosynthesis bifunctional protein CoaBC n=1 Tax=Fructobacillus papyriferae TaxID=2713171 RepID=A0ABS5QS25_9LACO|nr:bifunctional phosphopantothenoylcysteine decarboxylase/phosphopantothenate--cysteine ligase CoaBC [Fructobacillus papyriferae]MBS9334767.1 bifunctional phosphopantothenoylcysteine decarboxylase/phosphopantothenate--cysteine ligase CoaBC [Fructobacillus papyriferae]MCD2158757.1 bifunctional phosphopantothenoylcysteine decarboxylase/phosphopantothenate--cysteine ligase CoaBC [Fructobacillus papyriferae]